MLTLSQAVFQGKAVQMTEPEQSRPQSLPDPKVCHTRYLSEKLFDCMVKNPQSCRYVLNFGNGFYCRHPNPRQFERPPTGSG
jgi:hypothetical protein